MSEPEELRERIARVETKLDLLLDRTDRQNDEIAEIKDYVSQSKGGVKTLMGVSGLSGAIGGLLVKWFGGNN